MLRIISLVVSIFGIMMLLVCSMLVPFPKNPLISDGPTGLRVEVVSVKDYGGVTGLVLSTEFDAVYFDEMGVEEGDVLYVEGEVSGGEVIIDSFTRE
ncbi:MAG: hypothetical protein ACLFP2_00880 [Candidatus Woesearchaeota archaeon]